MTEHPLTNKQSMQRRLFYARKYCGNYAVYECIEEAGRAFERKVADDIEIKEEAELFAASLCAYRRKEASHV